MQPEPLASSFVGTDSKEVVGAVEMVQEWHLLWKASAAGDDDDERTDPSHHHRCQAVGALTTRIPINDFTVR